MYFLWLLQCFIDTTKLFRASRVYTKVTTGSAAAGVWDIIGRPLKTSKTRFALRETLRFSILLLDHLKG